MIFLIKLAAVFSSWPKFQDNNINILRKKRAFKMKWKAFFIIFECWMLLSIRFLWNSIVWENSILKFILKSKLKSVTLPCIIWMDFINFTLLFHWHELLFFYFTFSYFSSVNFSFELLSPGQYKLLHQNHQTTALLDC